MFNFVQQKKRLVQIVLALIILPFAFWGMDSYQNSDGGEALATVDGEKIGQQEFDNALRQQQDRMREMLGNNYDPACSTGLKSSTRPWKIWFPSVC